MSDLDLRLNQVVAELSMLLDDDLPDATDQAAIDLCDEFGIEDVEWMYNNIVEYVRKG